MLRRLVTTAVMPLRRLISAAAMASAALLPLVLQVALQAQLGAAARMRLLVGPTITPCALFVSSDPIPFLCDYTDVVVSLQHHRPHVVLWAVDASLPAPAHVHLSCVLSFLPDTAPVAALLKL